MEEEKKSQISQKQTTPEDKTLIFLDSLDDYLVLIETLSSTLRQVINQSINQSYICFIFIILFSYLNLVEFDGLTFSTKF